MAQKDLIEHYLWVRILERSECLTDELTACSKPKGLSSLGACSLQTEVSDGSGRDILLTKNPEVVRQIYVSMIADNSLNTAEAWAPCDTLCGTLDRNSRSYSEHSHLTARMNISLATADQDQRVNHMRLPNGNFGQDSLGRSVGQAVLGCIDAEFSS